MAHSGTVEHSPDGLIIWRADVGVALGPVTFDAYGIGIGVDAADPAAVVAVVAEIGDRDSDATCFEDSQFLDMLVEAPTGAVLKGPTLRDEVVRAATIHAVNTFFVGLLDEGVVALDMANAHAVCGEMSRARGRYLMSATTMDALLDLVETDGSRPVVEELEHMVAHCPAMDPDRRVAGIAATVAERHRTRWSTMAVPKVLAAADLSAGMRTVVTNPGDLLDLSLLPPRLVRFAGPDQVDLTLRIVDNETVEASAVLRDEIIAESTDVDGLFVVAMDSNTGELVSSAPCAVDGLTLIARLWLADRPIGDLHFALVAPTVPLSRVRGDPLSVQLGRLDRQCRHAWTQHRRATALVGLVTETSDDSAFDNAHHLGEILMADAKQWAENTEAELDELRQAVADPAVEQIVAGYLDGVQRLTNLVQSPGDLDGPLRPTLAELCAASGW